MTHGLAANRRIAEINHYRFVHKSLDDSRCGWTPITSPYSRSEKNIHEALVRYRSCRFAWHSRVSRCDANAHRKKLL